MNVGADRGRGAEAVIDLGEDWSVPEDPRPPIRRVSPRPWLVAVLAVLIVALPAASAAPKPPPVSLVTALSERPTAVVTVDRDTLFVAHRGFDGSQDLLVAHTLPAGTPRWQTPAGPIDVLRAVPAAGVLLAISYLDVGKVRGFDLATGSLLWTELAVNGWVTGDGTGLVTYLDDDGHGEVSRLDLRTGQPVWSRRFPLDSQLAGASSATGRGGPPRLAVVSRAGAVAVLDERTGATVASRQVDEAAAPEDSTWYGPVVTVIGDQVYVLHQSAIQGTLAAYDLDTLARQWQVTGDVGYPSYCGPVVCFDGAGLVGVDPATGAVEWQAPGWSALLRLAGGRLVVTTDAPGPASPLAVLDARGGNLLLHVSGWSVLSREEDGPVLLASIEPDGLRLAVLDTEKGVVVPIGYLSKVTVPDTCTVSGRLIACVTPEPGVRVWRYEA